MITKKQYLKKYLRTMTDKENKKCTKLCYGKNIPICEHFDTTEFRCTLGYNDLFDRYMIEESCKRKNKEK